MLEDKATFASVQVLCKVWTGPQATAFLASSGSNAELASLIIESAHSLYEKDESDIERAISESLGRVLPSIWKLSGLDLDCVVDVPMHQLFLGVVKSTTKLIVAWAKCRGKYSRFTKVFGRLMDMLPAPDWMKTRPYNEGTMGGWISENHLGFARIHGWFFAGLSAITADELEDELPFIGQDVSLWKVTELKIWLRNRGQTVLGRKPELQNRVKKKMQDPPSTIGDKNGSFELVVDVVKSLERLICKAMQTDWSKERGTDLDRFL